MRAIFALLAAAFLSMCTANPGPAPSDTDDTAAVEDTAAPVETGLDSPIDPTCGTDLGSETGWVVRLASEHQLEHGCDGNGTAEEEVYWWTAPVAGEWWFQSTSRCTTDSMMVLYENRCDGAELQVVDDTPGLFGDARIIVQLDEGEVVRVATRHLPTSTDRRPIGLHITLGQETDCFDGEDEDLDHETDCVDADCWEQCVDTGC